MRVRLSRCYEASRFRNDGYQMKFIDEVPLAVESGRGGPGAVSWRREKFVPRGGPDGGDGGKGGDVIFKVSNHLNSLLNFRFKKKYQAQNGAAGGAQNMTGPDGQDLVLEVPIGTIVKSSDGMILADLSKPEESFTLLQGGRGGKGNQFFQTSVNQAPTYAQPGEEGHSIDLLLELKLLADVGIIGFPNAGKSTLISHISAAKPKIADYPFTTLTPSLGVVQLGEFRTIVVADIPGLIPGAHQGVGLGIKFLKHIERTSCFVHLIDASELSGREPIEDFEHINTELKHYDEMHVNSTEFKPLSSRKQIVVLNKTDSISSERQAELKELFEQKDVQVRFISAATGLGLKDLIYEMGKMVNEMKAENELAAAEATANNLFFAKNELKKPTNQINQEVW
jgi:GTP-binding protein